MPGHRSVIGQDSAQASIGDDNILTLLHRLKQPTLFTRDKDFFKRDPCHPAYGLVWLDAAPEEARDVRAAFPPATPFLRPRPAAWAQWPGRIMMAFSSGSGIEPRCSVCAGKRTDKSGAKIRRGAPRTRLKWASTWTPTGSPNTSLAASIPHITKLEDIPHPVAG